jgi:hypothetical protein
MATTETANIGRAVAARTGASILGVLYRYGITFVRRSLIVCLAFIVCWTAHSVIVIFINDSLFPFNFLSTLKSHIAKKKCKFIYFIGASLRLGNRLEALVSAY